MVTVPSGFQSRHGKTPRLSQSVVRVKITDVTYMNGKNGVGMRCTVNISADHPTLGVCMQSTKGCLVFRNSRGLINLLTPVIYLGPNRVRHHPITFSPGLAKWLEGELERAHGQFITRRKTEGGCSISPAHYGNGATELDLGDTTEL